MKATLICPDRSPSVARLCESGPLAVTPMLGKCLVEYWIEHFAARGADEIRVVARDRTAQVHSVVGDGTRWGLHVAVVHTDFPAPPGVAPSQFTVMMDRLPGPASRPLFTNYASWFSALQAWMPLAQTLERIGQCEIQPGVWVGLRSRFDPTVRLIAPCWIGNYVTIIGDAVIGPGAILEDSVVVSSGARIIQSVVAPATFVGARVRIENSIVQHHHLINWATDSQLQVADAFWLSSLRSRSLPSRQKISPSLMKIEQDRSRLRISAVGELSVANAIGFREEIHSAFSSHLLEVEIDLTDTEYVDSCGLAVLCGLYRATGNLGISMRLLHPKPAVRQLLDLTQTSQLLGLGQTEPKFPGTPMPAIARFETVPAR